MPMGRPCAFSSTFFFCFGVYGDQEDLRESPNFERTSVCPAGNPKLRLITERKDVQSPAGRVVISLSWPWPLWHAARWSTLGAL